MANKTGVMMVCEFCEEQFNIEDWRKVCADHNPHYDTPPGCICEELGDTPLSACEVPGCDDQHKAVCQATICGECFEAITP